MKNFFLSAFLTAFLAVFITGCFHNTALLEAAPDKRGDYYEMVTSQNGISADTINLLGNYLLFSKLQKNPDELIPALEKLFSHGRDQEVRIALVECSLILAKKADSAEKAISCYLTAIIYANMFLENIAVSGNQEFFNPDVAVAIKGYNLALGELFDYLNKKSLHKSGAFELISAGGQLCRFETPLDNLPIPLEKINNIFMCADFRTRNLIHSSRRFGLGVQLICDTDGKSGAKVIPATLFLKSVKSSEPNSYKFQLQYIDTRISDNIQIAKVEFPLALDFTTPLAYIVKDPPAINFLKRAFLVDISEKYTGLYHLEPHNDNKIPVVLVHGLMSDIRTWMQLLNTLQSDPVIRKNFRFMGFSYSSGNPILYSAKLFREALQQERIRLKQAGCDLENFDKMVVIGHSMGGLLTRLLISDSTEDILREKLGNDMIRSIKNSANPEMMDMLFFNAFPSVKRAVFIAVPHRGSSAADTWFGSLGASLVRLPKKILSVNRDFLMKMIASEEKLKNMKLETITGIDNLSPKHEVLKIMALMPRKSIPLHSIIGNRQGNDIPGGSDGVVSYSSSHLDNASSEKVVKSGHSVQQNPLAIQEVRRILLLHIKQLKTSGNGE